MKYKKMFFKGILISFVIVFLTFLVLTTLFRKSATYKVFNSQYDTLLDKVCKKENESGYGKFKVAIDVNCDYNHSVGNEWTYNTYINSKSVEDGDIISCPLNRVSTLRTECIENDTYSDFESDTRKRTISNNLTITVDIINTENRGRYSGNTAKHTFTYTFSRYVDEKVLYNTIKLTPIQIANQKPFIWIIVVCLGCLCLFIVKRYINSQIRMEQKAIEAELRRQEKIKLEAEREKERERQEAQKKAEVLSLYGGKSIEELLSISGAPHGVTIDDDGLPAKYIDGVNIYEVYTSYNGSKYHKKTCRYAAKGKPHNLVYVNKKILPCSLCHPIEDDLAWYKKYKEILALKKKYEETQ